MAVHAEVVTEAVGEKGSRGASLENFVLVALEDAELEKTLNGNGVGEDVEVVVVDAALETCARLVLHLEDDIVNSLGLLGKLAANGERAGDVGTVVVVLGASINKNILLALEGAGVVDVVQRRRGATAGKDGVVRHLLGVVRVAALKEGGLELLFRLGRLGALHGGEVAEAGNIVGAADQRDLVLVLDDTGLLNGGLDSLKILGGKGVEGDVVRDLAVDGVDGGLGAGAGKLLQSGGKLGVGLDIVDVVQVEGVVDGGGQAGPDDVLGVDGGNEEGGLVGLDVVDEEAVGEVAAGEVVEEAALAGLLADSLPKVGDSIPEGHGAVVVFLHLGVTGLEVDEAVGDGALVTERLDDALGVGLAGVLALEDGLEVFGHGGQRAAGW